MLHITADQMTAMTRDHALGRVHRFLVEHSSDAALCALLASPTTCRDFWRPFYDRWGALDEHALAVRLSYVLAARAHGFDPRLADVGGDDGEIAMKCRLEAHRILAFAAFDAD